MWGVKGLISEARQRSGDFNLARSRLAGESEDLFDSFMAKAFQVEYVVSDL